MPPCSHFAGDFLELSLAQWRRQLSVNLDGSFLGCRLSPRVMARTGGGACAEPGGGQGRWPPPAAVAFLFDPVNDFITDAMLSVDGGHVVD